MNIFVALIDGAEWINLEESKQDFVLETKKIEIPGHPHAFNPSIIRCQGSLWMSFREIPPVPWDYSSWTGIVKLDENFCPVGIPQILTIQNQAIESEDARLITVGTNLFMVYSSHYELNLDEEMKNNSGGCRLYVAELIERKGKFHIKNMECLTHFEGENKSRMEKNWVPFDYAGHLLLAYSLAPHRILRPLLDGKGKCETFCCTQGEFDWNWGELRGGTPGLLEDDQYLAFFHSCTEMNTIHSNHIEMLHYFMGAYTFSRYPPFEITSISMAPIISKGFYEGPLYVPYWKPVRVIFPCGFIADQQFVWITYGRQDHEIWIAKMDKRKLLDSLAPVAIIQNNTK